MYCTPFFPIGTISYNTLSAIQYLCLPIVVPASSWTSEEYCASCWSKCSVNMIAMCIVWTTTYTMSTSCH